jgi:LMBR1 domain-containing protein 1
MLADPPLTLFLNAYFLWFDKFFPLFGAISVALFSMYLLLACLKGCFKFGLRLMWFTLHPMKINETYMNSFLFNVG